MARDDLRTDSVQAGVSAQEVVNIAISNIGIQWTNDGCTDFVWGVTNLAGAPFFDLRDNTTAGDPARPQDIPYVVPHSWGDNTAGDGWLAHYSDTSGPTANGLKAMLRPGDVVRVYKEGNSGEVTVDANGQFAAHSFVVVSVTGGNVQVVDNWGTDKIIQHSFDDIAAAFAPNGAFQSAYVARLDQAYVDTHFGTGLAGNGYGDFSGIAPAGFPPHFDLADLDGTNGFAIHGVNAGDGSGVSVSSAGDINGDGFDDLVIGAYRADPNGNAWAGSSYVIFGSGAGFSADLDLADLDGTNGFAIHGVNAGDYSGRSVSSAGDINGDGFDDLVIGAAEADPNVNFSAGSSYVVFGSGASFGTHLDLANLNGTNGFAIHGVNVWDWSGTSVSSAGDVNGDGYDDLVIGAPGADPNGNAGAGSSYVIFGSGAGFATHLDLANLNGTNGFAIHGVNVGDWSGAPVSSAGDINGDGYDDLVIGANTADPNGNAAAGSSYVIFGSGAGFATHLDLANLNGTNGFAIHGVNVGTGAALPCPAQATSMAMDMTIW